MSNINSRVFDLMQDAQRDFDFGPDSVYQTTAGRSVQLPAISPDSGELYINEYSEGRNNFTLAKTDYDPHLGTKFKDHAEVFPKSVKLDIAFISDDMHKTNIVEVPFDLNNIYKISDEKGNYSGGMIRYRQADGSDVLIIL